ncbi:flagellar basal body-associated FliL family protein [Sphingomonas sp. CFBP 13714]|uniref:flagellar basal body-associated FliL family protein n=1 Tax=Sphingomonas sp. CFBP 13714 TaxID=2775308 RepID=UPI001FD4F272|nr:flagellar basal body-associated FliL family protein [Sphingomonas sp. CFBP 13714]
MSKFVGASGFVAGFAARHDTAAQLLAHAFAPPMGFAAADIRDRVAAAPRRATGFAPQGATPTPPPSAPPPGPKHFSPADKDSNPTEGWDPLDPASETESFLDPLAAAHAAGYAEGLAAAAAVAQGNAARDQALLASLAAALATDRLDRDRVATQLRQTVLLLVGKLVGEIGISPDLLAGRIESATELLADSAGAEGDGEGGGHGGGEDAAPENHGMAPPAGEGGDRYASTYYALEKEFTANLQDSAHFIQVGVAVSTPYDNSVIDHLKTNEIAVRSAILMALGEATEDEVFTAQGKRKLQGELAKAINATLKQKEGFGGIGNVYFTSFVVQ